MSTNLPGSRIIMAIGLTTAISVSLFSTTRSVNASESRGQLNRANTEMLMARQTSEETPRWQRLFRRTPGGTSRGPGDLCVISPYGGVRYSWSRSPLFVWFDQHNSVQRVELRTSDGLDPIWTVNPQEVSDPQGVYGLYQVAYDDMPLTGARTFYFELYETREPEGRDIPLYTVPLELVPDQAYTEIQNGLNDLQQRVSAASEHDLSMARAEFFADRGYSRTDGAIELNERLENSIGQGLFLDVIRELFSTTDAADKETYIEYVYENYCLPQD